MDNFDALSDSRKQYFYGLASKPNTEATGREIYMSLPEDARRSPEHTERFLEDRHASRVDHEEGYDPENLTWEDASTNSGRQGDAMTPAEVDAANVDADQTALDIDADIAAENAGGAGADLLAGTAALIEDVVAPAIIAGRVAHMAHKRGASTSVTAGVGVGTFAVVTCTGLGPAILGGYAAWKLGRFAWRKLSK